MRFSHMSAMRSPCSIPASFSRPAARAVASRVSAKERSIGPMRSSVLSP